jgi:hypothetical protein
MVRIQPIFTAERNVARAGRFDETGGGKNRRLKSGFLASFIAKRFGWTAPGGFNVLKS